jgi:hypothetical protein
MFGRGRDKSYIQQNTCKKGIFAIARRDGRSDIYRKDLSDARRDVHICIIIQQDLQTCGTVTGTVETLDSGLDCKDKKNLDSMSFELVKSDLPLHIGFCTE